LLLALLVEHLEALLLARIHRVLSGSTLRLVLVAPHGLMLFLFPIQLDRLEQCVLLLIIVAEQALCIIHLALILVSILIHTFGEQM
jgi:hypothetical protein